MDLEIIDRMVRIATQKMIDNGEKTYSTDESMTVLRYFFRTYHLIFGQHHQMPSLRQITDAVAKMPIIQSPGERENIEVTVDEYPELIDAYFCKRFPNCDYGLSHFFSGNVRFYRYKEVFG